MQHEREKARAEVFGDGGLLVRGVRLGGKVWTWQRLFVPTVRSLRRLVRNELWIVGDQGTILYSLDGGDHWTSLDVPDVESPLHNIRFFESQGWILGNKVALRFEI